MGAVIAAAMMKAEREVVNRLRIAGATNPSAAIALTDLSHIQRRRLSHLTSSNLIRAVDGDRYWLDEASYIAHESTRRRMVMVVIALTILVLLFFIYYAAGNRQ